MKYIKFTYVDSRTGISVASHPAENGPAFPAVDGLTFEWARESAYPTPVPEFFGTCTDSAFTMIDGVLDVLSQADYGNLRADELRAQFKAERATAVAAIVVTVDGHQFDGDEISQGRMARAILALQADAQTSTLWVLANNQPTEVTLAQLQQALIAAGRAQSALWVES